MKLTLKEVSGVQMWGKAQGPGVGRAQPEQQGGGQPACRGAGEGEARVQGGAKGFEPLIGEYDRHLGTGAIVGFEQWSDLTTLPPRSYWGS